VDGQARGEAWASFFHPESKRYRQTNQSKGRERGQGPSTLFTPKKTGKKKRQDRGESVPAGVAVGGLNAV